MILYILDTDIFSMWLENHPSVCQRVVANKTNLAITIVTVQEVFNGWISRLNDPTAANQQVKFYGKLSNVVSFLRDVTVLDFDEDAEQIFKQMLNQNQALRRKRVERDMRIAAIALTYDAVLVTRNHRDFSPVPNLNLEDWSI